MTKVEFNNQFNFPMQPFTSSNHIISSVMAIKSSQNIIEVKLMSGITVKSNSTIFSFNYFDTVCILIMLLLKLDSYRHSTEKRVSHSDG